MLRTMEENKFILERAVDGMNLAVGAYFRYAHSASCNPESARYDAFERFL